MTCRESSFLMRHQLDFNSVSMTALWNQLVMETRLLLARSRSEGVHLKCGEQIDFALASRRSRAGAGKQKQQSADFETSSGPSSNIVTIASGYM